MQPTIKHSITFTGSRRL